MIDPDIDQADNSERNGQQCQLFQAGFSNEYEPQAQTGYGKTDLKPEIE